MLAGLVGRYATGGGAWADLQYLLGLRNLGHDVYYLEDCGETSWVYDWDKQEWTAELGYPAKFVGDCLNPFGFEGKWIYRTTDEAVGMGVEDFRMVCSEADLLIMRSIPLWVWREEYSRPRRRVFIDVDPGFTQMFVANGDEGWARMLAHCDRLFTIAQRVGAADCPIPTGNRTWLKTVAPVAMTEWPYVQEDAATHFTSVMNWRGFHDVTYKGVAYGQKDKEFPKFIDLPHCTLQPFRIALNGPDVLSEHGWEVVSGEAVSKTVFSYRAFIQQSRAEFGVAKHGYVHMRGGWFSDRSVCYLASGRPLLLQDTGLSDWLPVGEGLLTFQDLQGAARGIERINADYGHHRRAARQLAENYFAADKVLPLFLDSAMS